MSPSAPLSAVLRTVAAATPEPAEVVQTPPPELVTPGTLGFLVTFGVAVAVVLLVRDMVRRNRRIVMRAERRDQLRRSAADGPPGDRPAGGAVAPGPAEDVPPSDDGPPRRGTGGPGAG